MGRGMWALGVGSGIGHVNVNSDFNSYVNWEGDGQGLFYSHPCEHSRTGSRRACRSWPQPLCGVILQCKWFGLKCCTDCNAHVSCTVKWCTRLHLTEMLHSTACKVTVLVQYCISPATCWLRCVIHYNVLSVRAIQDTWSNTLLTCC